MNTLQLTDKLTDTEKTAIATIIIKMIGCDKKYEADELRFLQDLYMDHDIPLIISNRPTLTYDEVLNCIDSMPREKKDFLHNVLTQLAEYDGKADITEYSFIDSLPL